MLTGEPFHALHMLGSCLLPAGTAAVQHLVPERPSVLANAPKICDVSATNKAEQPTLSPQDHFIIGQLWGKGVIASRWLQVDAAVRSSSAGVDIVKLSYHAGGYMDLLASFCAAPLFYYR